MTNQRIFPAAQPLAELISEGQAKRQAYIQENPAFADIYRDPAITYTRLYETARKRLEQPDMLPLAEAARRMKLAPEAALRKANRGQLVLIDIEGVQAVPDWVLDRRGRIKPFQAAIAREFAASGKEFIKFMSYLKFMGEQSLQFQTELPRASLKDVFRAVGITQGSCQVMVETPMFEAADRAPKNAVIMAAFINQMGAELTRIGGMGNPNEGGFSEEFLDRYVPKNIPGRDRWKCEFLI